MMFIVGARALRRTLRAPAASLIAAGVMLAMAMGPRLAAAQPAAPAGAAPRTAGDRKSVV